MKCDEIQQLSEPYLDSELDARTALEVQRHLAACAGCARMFAEQEKLDASITASLKQGPRTAALWQQIERSVAAAGPSAGGARLSISIIASDGWRSALSVLVNQLCASLRPSPQAWAGLAAVWVVILVLNLSARGSDAQATAGHRAPSASQVHFALVQKELLMTELVTTSETAPADRPKTALPSPRSDRRAAILNA